MTWGIFVSNTGSATVPLSVGGILDGEMIGFAFLDTDLFSYKKVNELSFNALCNALIAQSARLVLSGGNYLLIKLFVALVSAKNLPFNQIFYTAFLLELDFAYVVGTTLLGGLFLSAYLI